MLNRFLLAIGGLVGLMTLAGLFIAFLQLLQAYSGAEGQNNANATQLAILGQQLTIQEQIATFQAEASEPINSAEATSIAEEISQLRSTQAALEATFESLSPRGTPNQQSNAKPTDAQVTVVTEIIPPVTQIATVVPTQVPRVVVVTKIIPVTQIVAITQIAVVAPTQVPPTEAPAIPSPTTQPPPSILSVRARIDGISRLVIQGDTVQWFHIAAAAPGRWIQAPTFINGIGWYPNWPDIPDAQNRDCQCYSSVYQGISSITKGSSVTLQIIQARERVSVIQQPSQSNGYTFVVEFDDAAEPDKTFGDDWYEIKLLGNEQ
jgi:hypothetical protein